MTEFLYCIVEEKRSFGTRNLANNNSQKIIVILFRYRGYGRQISVIEIKLEDLAFAITAYRFAKHLSTFYTLYVP